MICLPCNQRLDASYDFKCQIQNSDEKLRQILKLKSSSNDSVTNASTIVTAIIADVISSVISSEKENTEKQEVCSTNFCNDNFCFTKDETVFCLNSEKSLFCYEKESSHSRLNDTEQRKSLENVNVYKSLLEDDSVRQIDSIKQEFVLLDDHMVQTKDVPLKGEASIEESQQISEETSKTDSIQDDDDDEKPLISRTTRLRCTQCIKSFHTKVALQRHAIVHKRKTKLRYVCYVCDKQYSTLAKVKNHVAICHEARDRKENIQHKRISYEQNKAIASVQDKRINSNVQVSI